MKKTMMIGKDEKAYLVRRFALSMFMLVVGIAVASTFGYMWYHRYVLWQTGIAFLFTGIMVAMIGLYSFMTDALQFLDDKIMYDEVHILSEKRMKTFKIAVRICERILIVMLVATFVFATLMITELF